MNEPNAVKVPGLWEASVAPGTMLVRARNRRAAAKVAADAFVSNNLGDAEARQYRVVSVHHDTLTNVSCYTIEYQAVGVAPRTFHLAISRPDVFV